ncbi:hypothetical protein ACIRNU_25100 [Streptomyces rochei]|uniref:hypothetical protein n=1 Tax=Streptomyces rochei TaxID=1928 RepID=UPI0037F62D9F
MVAATAPSGPVSVTRRAASDVPCGSPPRDRLPGSLPVPDTAGPGFFGAQEGHGALGKVAARTHWYCPDPAGPADWRPGVRVVASHTLTSLPGPLVDELPVSYREMLSVLTAQRLPQAEGYRLSLPRMP